MKFGFGRCRRRVGRIRVMAMNPKTPAAYRTADEDCISWRRRPGLTPAGTSCACVACSSMVSGAQTSGAADNPKAAQSAPERRFAFARRTASGFIRSKVSAAAPPFPAPVQ